MYASCTLGLQWQALKVAQHCSVMSGIWCLQIWSTGDPSAADTIMADDVRFVDLLFEQETNGREEFKKMIGSVFKVQHVLRISCHAVAGDRDTSVTNMSYMVWLSSQNSCVAYAGIHSTCTS